MALYPGRKGNRVNEAFFEHQENRLADLMPDDARMADVIRVIDLPAAPTGAALYLNANCVAQQAVCYLAAPPSP